MLMLVLEISRGLRGLTGFWGGTISGCFDLALTAWMGSDLGERAGGWREILAGMPTIYTLGHSSHAAERFRALLEQHAIEVLVDTRSAPYSRYTPQFDRESLKELAGAAGMKYMWLGDVVGGRPRDERCYDTEGRVLYGRVAEQTEFREAMERLKRGAEEFRVALLCSEEDPAHCHRRLLITRVLLGEGVEVRHIRGDGALQTDAEVEALSGKRLIEVQPALFGELEEASWRSSAPIGKPAARSVME
jgi:uncharacterized protein (DUF488 family)